MPLSSAKTHLADEQPGDVSHPSNWREPSGDKAEYNLSLVSDISDSNLVLASIGSIAR